MGSGQETNRGFFSRKMTRRELLGRTGGVVLGGAAVLVVGCGSGSESPSSQTGSNPEIESGFAHFKSQLYPYELDYPPSIYQPSQSEYYGIKTDFFAKSKSSTVDFVIVRAEFVQDNIDTDAFMTSTIEKYKQDVDRAGASIENINTDESKKIGGVQARIIEVGVSGNGGVYALKAYIFVRDGLGWDVHYYNDIFEFDKNLPIFQKMVDSFRFTD